ncbi:MAG: hypothetical protein KDD11_14505 [Acidobacteria bacterium]|nr:hypothetical protein [Acidobacteriota bacterium]
MATVERAIVEDWLQRELDGDLSEREQRELTRELEDSAELRLERRALQALNQQLALSRIPVSEDFRDRVMSDLPSAAWEPRRTGAWRWPVAFLAVLVAALAVLGRLTGGATVETGSGVLGAIASVFGLVRAGILAGTGLLGYSWKGLRLAFEQVLAGSPTALAGVVLVIAGLNLLLYLGLRRRARPAAARVSGARRGR